MDLDASAGITQGSFLDPWGKPYHFRLDVNYQNQITYPFATPQIPGTPVTAGFLIWSVGPDGIPGTSDDVCTNVVQSALFSDDISYLWSYDNEGLKVAQLRFYEVPTNTLQ